MQLLRYVTMGLLLCVPQSACFAAVIDNLSGKPQTIETQDSTGWQARTLKTGEIFNATGKLAVRFDGREIHIEDDEEYAIWKDGKIGMQHRRTHSVGRIN